MNATPTVKTEIMYLVLEIKLEMFVTNDIQSFIFIS